MSMHLVGPYMTTTKYNSKGKKVPNSERERKAKLEHEAWLRKRGLHPDQKAKNPIKKAEINRIPDYRADLRNSVPLSNAVGNGFKNGVMENLHKEKPEVQKEILAKASRVMPLYNKGGLQYCTPDTDLTTVGSKSRRG